MNLFDQSSQISSVKEGIIYTNEHGRHTYYRINGKPVLGRVQVQKAETSRFTSDISKLIWDNLFVEYPDNILLSGILIKKY
jgi:sensor histidine kinase regulating citrate/malate metabolism